MSEALTLSSHAISSSALSRIASHPRSDSSPRSHSIFSSRDSPALILKIEVCGTPGLSSQSTERRSGTPASAKVPPSSRPSCALVQSESNATTAPSSNLLRSHSGMSTCSGTRVLWSTTPVPSSCSTAWMKYLESVQSPAWSSVTTTSPASPVKPVSHLTCFHRSAGYSLWCGSDPPTITASQPRPRISALRASMRSAYLFVSIDVVGSGAEHLVELLPVSLD